MRHPHPALCTATHRHDPDRPRHAADGLNLCYGCHAALGRQLGELPDLHADVLAQLPSVGDRTAPPVSGSHLPPLPYNPRAGDLLGQIRHDLGWLTALVATERGIGRPRAHPGDQAAWLGRHVDWLAAHRDAGAFKGTISELVGRSYNVIDPERLPLVIGPCAEELDDGPCGGMLFASVRRDGDPRPSEIWCDGCALALDPAQWRRFGRRYLKVRGRIAG